MDDTNEAVKVIVEELSKEPFKYEFNVASFCNLKHSVLLRILQTVLGEIDPNYKDEVGTDTSDPMQGKRSLELLRVLRYYPKHKDPESIQDGLEGLVPETIWEILAWLLLNKDELKQRAYLAQYLVKIQIPDEMMIDNDVAKCFEEYENKIEVFKETHKKLQAMKLQLEKRSVCELVSDLGRIGHDVDCLSRKVDNLKNRVGDFPGKQEYLEQAKMIRKAREGKLVVTKQMEDEEMKLTLCKKNLEGLQHRLIDFTELNNQTTQKGALERLEQNTEFLKVIVEERLPQQIQDVKRQYIAAQIVESNPLLCRADLQYHVEKISELKTEIFALEEQNKMREEDQALKFVRQKMINNSQQKLELANGLAHMNRDLEALQEELEYKRQQHQIPFQSDDGWVLQPNGFREYVKNIRAKSGKYKTMRAELQALQAEVGNLSTTKFILNGELKESEEKLEILEKQLGITGFTSVGCQLETLSSEKAVVEHKKLESIDQMARLAKDLNDQVIEKKYELEPLIAEVNSARNNLQSLISKAKNAKNEMEEQMGSVFISIEKLEKHKSDLLKCFEREEMEFVKMEAEIPILKTELTRATGLGGGGPFARKNKDRVLAKIVESERVHQVLKEEVGQVEEIQEYERNQQKMWAELAEMFQLKLDILQEQFAEEVSEQKNLDCWEANPSD